LTIPIQVQQEWPVRTLPASAQQFIENFGLALASEGLPRTAARLLGLILMLDEGGDLEFLADQLNVSRASISTSTRLLESIGAIERHSIRGQRRIVYKAAQHGRNRGMEGVLFRMRRTRDVVTGARRDLPKHMAGAKARLHQVEDYYVRSIEMIEAALSAEENREARKRQRSR
jgi:DNA-binding transcriptional regulator GbsR (MarR family)